MKNSLPKLRRQTHPRETGIALVTVLVMIVLMATLVSITSILAIGNKKSGTDTVLGTKAQYAAEAGLENAMYQIYYKTRENWAASADKNNDTKFDACMFRKWLTGRWRIGGATTPTDAELILNGNKDCPYASATATVPMTASGATFPTLFDGVTINDSDLLNKTIEGNSTNGVRYEVSVSRKEDSVSGETILSMTSTGIIKQNEKDVAFRKLAQVAKISSRAYDGDRFAMLTNATNCSFCHLHIDTMQRAYAAPNSTEIYNRARVAVLESGLSLSDGWHNLDTFVAGTLYARGSVSAGDHVYAAAWAKDASGTVKPGMVAAGPISDGIDSNGAVLKGILGNYLSNTNTSDTAKAANVVDASTAPGATTKFAKIYSNYPKENNLTDAKYGGQWPDGPVPDDFPTVITEGTTSKDGLISDAEWSSYLTNAPTGNIIAGTNTRIFGVRRPSSSSTNAILAATPVSYDPTSAEVNPTLYATTIQGSSDGANFSARLTQFIADVRANNTAGIATFTTNWKGWLVQQALASTNNRDLEPGVASISSSSTAPISWPTNNGVAVNNFWVQYNPTAQSLTLRFRDYTAGTPAVPGTSVVNAPVTTGNQTCGSGSGFTDSCTVPNSPTTNSSPRTFTNVQAVLRVRNSAGTSFSSQVKDFPPGATISCTTSNFVFTSLPASPTFRDCRYTYTYTTVTTTPGTPAVSGTRVSPDPTISIPINETDIFPQTNNKAKDDLESNGQWDGNVIIDAGRINDVGQDKAVTINGTIHVNGDVVIRGQVKGRGRIVARGNIYVVGDLVYGCGNHACRITDTDSTLPSYRNWRNLPMLGLLAGGNVIVGDYDFPDYRATNSTSVGGGVYDLVNDQVGRNINDAGNATGIPGGSAGGFPFYSVPGATGTNTPGSGMGFVPMIAANSNWKNRDSAGYITTTTGSAQPKRYFQSMPFGPIVGRSGFGSYENSGGFVDTVGNSTIISLYPSNGPVKIGSSTNNGFGNTTQIPTGTGGFSCSASTPSVQASRFGGGTVNFNYGFYCPPSSLTGRYLRNSLTPTTGDPSTDTTVWTQQSPQNAALDGGIGMSTGWMAGLVGRTSGGNFSQIGDLSQSRLIKLMWLTTMEVSRDVDPLATGANKGPLRTDGIFYSAHGIYSLARSFSDKWADTTDAATALAQRSNTEGRWIHNGSVVAAELGFLITGDYTDASVNTGATIFPETLKTGSHGQLMHYTTRRNKVVDFNSQESYSGTGSAFNGGPSMGIFYDERLAGFLNLTSGVPVQIQRIGGYQQVSR
jgi:Tfp pilus assembly protein PilX